MEIFNENRINYNSFIYPWVDKKTSKFYIGSHIGDLNDGYKFGGIDIKKEYKKRPKDFIREIISLHIVKDNKDIREIEEGYLMKYDVENNELSYNRTNNSYGGHHKKSVEKRLSDIDENGLNHFQRASIKMVETRKRNNSYETAKVKEYETKRNNKNSFKMTKEKISNTLKGSKWVNKNDEIKYVKSDEYIKLINDGWVSGREIFKSYEECSDIAKKNNITSERGWRKLTKVIDNLPYHPNRKFKDQWKSWGIFLQKKK